MRFGFFGGSFDPPHLGHLAVAKAALKSFHLDRVLLAPTAQQPLKPDGPVASFEDRLAMVGIFCAGEDRFQASDVEAPHADGSPNYTVDTLGKLREGAGVGDEIFVIVGIDAFLDLRRWREPERLLSLAEWVVVSRPGFEVSEGLESMALSASEASHVHPLDGVSEAASATRIRELLAAGEDCGELLPAPLLRYIREHRLYGTGGFEPGR